MKFFLRAIVALLLLSPYSFAANDVDKTALVKQAFDVSGANEWFGKFADFYRNIMQKKLREAELADEVVQTLLLQFNTELDEAAAQEAMLAAYTKQMNHEQLQSVISWYQSESGQAIKPLRKQGFVEANRARPEEWVANTVHRPELLAVASTAMSKQELVYAQGFRVQLAFFQHQAFACERGKPSKIRKKIAKDLETSKTDFRQTQFFRKAYANRSLTDSQLHSVTTYENSAAALKFDQIAADVFNDVFNPKLLKVAKAIATHVCTKG